MEALQGKKIEVRRQVSESLQIPQERRHGPELRRGWGWQGKAEGPRDAPASHSDGGMDLLPQILQKDRGLGGDS